jgi:hypothetical protein
MWLERVRRLMRHLGSKMLRRRLWPSSRLSHLLLRRGIDLRRRSGVVRIRRDGNTICSRRGLRSGRG